MCWGGRRAGSQGAAGVRRRHVAAERPPCALLLLLPASAAAAAASLQAPHPGAVQPRPSHRHPVKAVAVAGGGDGVEAGAVGHLLALGVDLRAQRAQRAQRGVSQRVRHGGGTHPGGQAAAAARARPSHGPRLR